MLTYDEFKEAMDNGFIKGDTVQIVRKNGKIHDYVLDGEQVEPHEILSLEKVSDIIKELADELGVSKTYIEKIIRVVNIHSELLKKKNRLFLNIKQQEIIKNYLDKPQTVKKHAWKVCIRHKRIGGSNPLLSSINSHS